MPGTESLAIFPSRGTRWLRWLLGDGKVDTRLLNDALFAAAIDLEKRAPDHRKMMIVISDGQAVKNTHSFGDSCDRLVKSQIQVYGVTVSVLQLPVATSVLQAYTNATGGDVYSAKLGTACSPHSRESPNRFGISMSWATYRTMRFPARYPSLAKSRSRLRGLA